ncbi:UNVERIFIED_CONTAM: helix-turn-helix domain-containing protein [Streptococcus canis]
MNLEEKEKIKILREKGLGYTAIAKEINISVNTIKSYCKRHGLGGTKTCDEDTSLCEYCGKPVIQKLGRKKKRFCSDKCRNSWWNKNRELVSKKANYECICANCGKTFISYGNKNRKYCSHECYISARFGGECHEDN